MGVSQLSLSTALVSTIFVTSGSGRRPERTAASRAFQEPVRLCARVARQCRAMRRWMDQTDMGARSGKILLHLHTKFSLVVAISVSAFLPGPTDVTMTGVDMNYTLQWDWPDAHHSNSTTFAAEYNFPEDRDQEQTYTRVCTGSGQHSCDFSHRLDFSCSYILRVRAESGGHHSDWTYVQFTPDEDGKLGPPNQVHLEAHVAMVIVTVSKLLRSTVVKLQYSVQYWERPSPTQKQWKDSDVPYISLDSLKPWTEYCVQVSVFDSRFGMRSNYTAPQCTFTKGHSSNWWMAPTVLCSILAVGGLAYLYFGFKRQWALHKIPDDILKQPLELPSLLIVQEETCEVPLVTTQHPLEEHDGSPGWIVESTHHESDSIECDSGFISANISCTLYGSPER